MPDAPPLRSRPLIGAVIRVYEERFTDRGRFVLWAAAVFALVGADTRRTQVFELFAVAFALLVVATIAAALRRAGLHMTGHLPVRLSAGQPLDISLRLATSSSRGQEDVLVSWPRPLEAGPVPEGQPGEAFVDLAPGAGTDVPLRILAPRRGRWPLRGPTARVTDPLRLVASGPIRLPGETVTVYPRWFPIEDLEVPLGRRYQPGGIPLTSSTGDSSEFVGTREYREGDPLRHIHWRSWARSGTPVVKEYQEEYFCRIALVLDTFLPGRPGPRELEAFEASISLLASIADFFSRGEYVVDILAAGPDIYEISAGRSLGRLENVLEVLACLEPSPDPPFARVGPALFDRLARLTTVIAVLQDWGPERRDFLARVHAEGASVRAFVVGPSAGSEPIVGVDPELGEVEAVGVEQITTAITAGGTLRFPSSRPGVGALRA